MQNANTDVLVSASHFPVHSHESLLSALEAAAEQDAPFLRFHAVRDADWCTARDAQREAHRWARVLHTHGVQRGDRVPLLLPTGPAFVGALLGCMLLGALPIPLAAPMTFGGLDRYLQHLCAIVEDADACVLVTFERMQKAIAGNSVLQQKLQVVLTERALLDVPSLLPMLWPSIATNETAFLQYTSGTTGKPKGVVLSHRAVVSNTAAIASALGLTPNDVGVSWLPMFHDMGLVGALLTAMCHPYLLHLMPPEAFLLRPHRWIETLARVGGTVSAAPNFAYELCVARENSFAPELSLDRWRLALSGAEPVLPTTVQRFCKRFASHQFASSSVTPVYGMAECTLAVTIPQGVSRYKTTTRRNGKEAVSVGTPVAGTRIAICNEHGTLLHEGEEGEVLVSGPSVMDGYFRNESASAAVLRDGWLHTGDLGFMRNGELFLVGRARDVIIKAGRNYHAHDIERVAEEVAGVRRGAVAAFARSNEMVGTEDLLVVAETSVKDPAERDRIARSVVGELLAALGVKADEVHLWPVGAVPRTTSGKVRRAECARVLRERAHS